MYQYIDTGLSKTSASGDIASYFPSFASYDSLQPDKKRTFRVLLPSECHLLSKILLLLKILLINL